MVVLMILGWLGIRMMDGLTYENPWVLVQTEGMRHCNWFAILQSDLFLNLAGPTRVFPEVDDEPWLTIWLAIITPS